MPKTSGCDVNWYTYMNVCMYLHVYICMYIYVHSHVSTHVGTVHTTNMCTYIHCRYLHMHAHTDGLISLAKKLACEAWIGACIIPIRVQVCMLLTKIEPQNLLGRSTADTRIQEFPHYRLPKNVSDGRILRNKSDAQCYGSFSRHPPCLSPFPTFL